MAGRTRFADASRQGGGRSLSRAGDPPAPFLPYGRQFIDDADVAALVAAVRGEYLTTGPLVGELEAAFAGVVGARHAIACANGTAALHLAMMAARIGPGDVCIVPTVTFLATANAARFVGAEVVFADVDPETGLIGVEHVEAALAAAGRPVKAVVTVHLAGQIGPLDELNALATRHGVLLVEDACHALGTEHRLGGAQGRVGDGRYSDLQTFSFHPVKTVTCGEGGMITTNDAGLAERAALLRSHGMVRDPARWEMTALGLDADGEANPWFYEMPELGYNYRLSDLQAALARSQLAKLPFFVQRRRRLAALYDEQLATLAPVVRSLGKRPGCDPVLHLYVVLIDFAAIAKTRAQVMRELRERGIGTQVHYIPVHHQPYYRRSYGRQTFPGAEAYYARCLSLPLHPGMRDADVRRVVEALKAILFESVQPSRRRYATP